MGQSSDRRIPSLRLSSDSFRAADRFELWRNAILDLHELSMPEGMQRTETRVRTTVWNLGGIVAAEASLGAQIQTRSRERIRRSSVDHYLLTLPTDGGEVNFAIGDQCLSARKDALLVTDLGQPDRQEITAGNQIVFFVPRDGLDSMMPKPVSLHGFFPRGPLGILVADHLRNLVGVLDHAPAEAAAALSQATVQLLAATVSGAPSAIDAARPEIHRALGRRIVQYIDANLLDPELSQDRLCRTFHLSRASLYRLFNPVGGIASFIQARRLARIRAVLGSPDGRQHLGQLAERHGFASQAQMSRAYKAQYGHAPSETPLNLTTPVHSPYDDHSRPNFQHWMHGLRYAGGNRPPFAPKQASPPAG